MGLTPQVLNDLIILTLHKSNLTGVSMPSIYTDRYPFVKFLTLGPPYGILTLYINQIDIYLTVKLSL